MCVRLVCCFAAGGASAFDNAQHALSCGAGEVHVFVRRKVSQNQLKGAVAVAVSSSLFLLLFRPALLMGEMCSLGATGWFSKHWPRCFLMQELPRINPIRKMEFAGVRTGGAA